MDSFSVNMKASELVEFNPGLLMVLSRLGIVGSFGERTVSEVCAQHGLDAHTVILICRVYSSPDFVPGDDDLRKCSVADVLRYLHCSHDYYLRKALESMAESIEALIAPCRQDRQQVIWNFFLQYKSELRIHFEFEEGSVIPYVQNLMLGRHDPSFSIDRFEENHSNIDEKLSDLKNLVMKSLPRECDDDRRISLLVFLFSLQNDLRSHTYIEDNILVPLARLLENPMLPRTKREPVPGPEGNQVELSDREKEILVSVASGLINKEIADKHNISVNTVITHRKNISRKTGIKTVAGLTVYAILNNLIDIKSIE